jgi:hypothetical protein
MAADDEKSRGPISLERGLDPDCRLIDQGHD